MAVLVFGTMSYCPNYRVFHRHTSYERGLRNFGYPEGHVRNLAAYRYDEVESARKVGYGALRWAGPCDRHKDLSVDGCAVCRETYLKFKSEAASMEALCFAEAVLARVSEGDLLFMVTLPIPKVAIRDNSAYVGRRIGSFQRLSKRKRRAQKRAFEKKKRDMWDREGLRVGPEYMTRERVKERKDAHKRWLEEHKDDYYQLECIRDDVMRSVVESEDCFIDREAAQGGGFRYRVIGDGQYQPVRDVPRLEVQRVRPPALRWYLKQFEMRVRKLGRKAGFGIKYQAVIEQGSKGGFHYHLLLHMFPADVTEEWSKREKSFDWRVHAELKSRFEREWFEVSGNIQFDSEEWVVREDGTRELVVKTWFRRVHDAREAASYVAKYLGKGWFSRRQTSKFLNLRIAARDARLFRAGFCEEKLSPGISSHFQRDKDSGFLFYDSPLEESDIESAGCTEWVGIELVPQAPKSQISVLKLQLKAVFWSSRPCRHPAAAKSGICADAEGVIQDLIPSAWWFPKESLFRYLSDGTRETLQVEELHAQLTRAQYSAVRSVTSAVQGSPLVDAEVQLANRDSILFEGRFPVRLQLDGLAASLSSMRSQVNSALSGLAGSVSAFSQVDVKSASVRTRDDPKPSWYRLSGRIRDYMRTRGSESLSLSLSLSDSAVSAVPAVSDLTEWQARALRARFDAAADAVSIEEFSDDPPPR